MTRETEREAFTYSPQDGENGHCFAAQVWDADGKNVATIDGANADEATQRAKIITEALNNAARVHVGKGDSETTRLHKAMVEASSVLDRAVSLHAEDFPKAKPVEVGLPPWLIGSAQALLTLDAEGLLVPHGIGGHARSIIQEFINAHSASPSTPAGATEAGELLLLYSKFLEGLNVKEKVS